MASKPTILRFKFDDFENLPSERDKRTKSEMVTDESGNVWRLGIYPGGMVRDDVHGEAPDDDEEKRISLFLINVNGGASFTATIAFIVRDAAGSVYFHHSLTTVCAFRARGDFYGWDKLLKRSELLDKENNVLVDGALIVDVVVQRAKGENDLFYPSNPHLKNMLTFLENGEDADVSFKVGDTTIAAHKLILKMNAPILHSFCPKRGDAPVSIKDTTPQVFRIVLRYIYGGGASEAIDTLNSYNEDNDENARDKLGKEIIEAANRYGIVGLKLAVETALVKRCVVDMENAVDWILFADAKTCPLLKEHATNYFSVMAKDIIKSETWKKLKESPDLMEEMIFVMSNTPENDCFDQTSKMSVDELRKALNEKGLDVDGSKEMLVSRLDESNANKRKRTE